ncbi:Alpha/beta hydrolase fold-1 [Mycena sanguinolenta]|nr:Alpha/beta hydrolase fold-1 [Mycena sanguinolenta]
MHELTVTPVVFDCPPNGRDPPGHILKMTAKRYWTPDSDANAEGLSLLFAHCVASHKEQWEPIISQVFRTQAGKMPQNCVREAWAVDWQSHGEAGVLNREVLPEDGVCVSHLLSQFPVAARVNRVSTAAVEWSAAIAAFICSPYLLGRRIVGIGHSGGAGAIVLSLRSLHTSSPLPFTSLILIEPTMATPALYARTMAPHIPAIVAATRRKRDVWPSRADAEVWMRARAPWRTWDKCVFALFIEHALVPTPSGSGEVTLKCDRRHEARGMADVEPHMTAVEVLDWLGGRVPVHLVWANGSELVPRIMQDALSAPTDIDADGSETQNSRRFASITRLEGGHRIVQESPDEVARAVCRTLDSIFVAEGDGRSRL